VPVFCVTVWAMLYKYLIVFLRWVVCTCVCVCVILLYLFRACYIIGYCTVKLINQNWIIISIIIVQALYIILDFSERSTLCHHSCLLRHISWTFCKRLPKLLASALFAQLHPRFIIHTKNPSSNYSHLAGIKSVRLPTHEGISNNPKFKIR